MLHSIPEVQAMIAAGKSLFLAGSPEAMLQLPEGNWIGGSTSYFMDADGGVTADDRIYVTETPAKATAVSIGEYTAATLPQLYLDAPENGFTFLIVPNEAPFLQAFAERASTCDGFLMKPVLGWIAGVPVQAIGVEKSMAVDGRTVRPSGESALAMHVALPANSFAEIEIVNIFQPAAGDTITFPNAGFQANECFINHVPGNFADYVTSKQIDVRLPLIADYCGSHLNVSLKSVDAPSGTVNLYAPVFPGVDYHFAEPVGDYAEAFRKAIPEDGTALFSCNCILNYVHGGLEGKRTGTVTGPVTFGEIAHQLLNQTMIQLKVRETVE